MILACLPVHILFSKVKTFVSIPLPIKAMGSLAMVLLVISIGCNSPTKLVPTNQGSATYSNHVGQAKADSIETSPCVRIAEIETLPFKDEPVNDDAYNAIMEAKDAAIPCLIEKVTDTTKMPDPRQAPKYPEIENTVGDVAYFVLLRVAHIKITEALPKDVQEKYKEDGVYAYFEFVAKQENRRKLQANLYRWYKDKYGR